MGAAELLFFFFFRAITRPTTISPSTAIPPTTPPTIAPIGADFFDVTATGEVGVGPTLVVEGRLGPEVDVDVVVSVVRVVLDVVVPEPAMC